VTAVLAGIFGIRAAHAVLTDDGTPTLAARIVKSVMGLLPALLVAAAGVLLCLGLVQAGLGFIAAGAMLAIIVAVVIAWVALVEVLR
jgi:hypothetical protein